MIWDDREEAEFEVGTCQNCGHDPEDHVRLPGHPDGAEECHGSEDCGCGSYRT